LVKPTMVLDDGRRLEDTEMYCSGIAVPCRRFAVRNRFRFYPTPRHWAHFIPPLRGALWRHPNREIHGDFATQGG